MGSIKVIRKMTWIAEAPGFVGGVVGAEDDVGDELSLRFRRQRREDLAE